jgi:hypothetical protein
MNEEVFNERGLTEDEEKALVLYALLSRDPADFVEMLLESTKATLDTLYLMFVVENAAMGERDKSLNDFGAAMVESHYKHEHWELPEIPN